MNRRFGGGTVAPDGTVHLDPGAPDTVDYLRELVVEIVREVQPDGVILTGLQYPGQEWGYSEEAVASFRAVVGGEGSPPMDNDTWGAWRRERITETLRQLRSAIREERPGTPVGVLIEAEGNPPSNWDEWLASTAYSRHMQDWLSWCTDGLVDEVVLAVHERHNPQRSTISNWVHFLNNHSFSATPVISLAGSENFLEGLEIQYKQVRSRGAGTVLSSYDRPVRGTMRGFYDGFGRLVFRDDWGGPIPGFALRGPREERYFAMMTSPPPSATPRRAVLPFDEGREQREALVFASPTPAPTPTPDVVAVDDELLRQITLTNGNTVEVFIREVTSTGYRVQAPGGTQMLLSRGSVRQIEPPL